MYEKTLKLKHNEIPAKVDINTGEVTVVNRPNNIPADKEFFNAGYYKKAFDKSWDFLLDNLTAFELRIVVKMSQMARMNSNSLTPLNDASSQVEISETFGIHRNQVKKVFDRLLRLGVYAEFRFGDSEGNIKHYWVLNPYISFKGKTVSKGIVDLFRETIIAKLYLQNSI